MVFSPQDLGPTEVRIVEHNLSDPHAFMPGRNPYKVIAQAKWKANNEAEMKAMAAWKAKQRKF